jgi:hypothetical protein
MGLGSILVLTQPGALSHGAARRLQGTVATLRVGYFVRRCKSGLRSCMALDPEIGRQPNDADSTGSTGDPRVWF